MIVLAGDIGGTKVDLGLFEPRAGSAAPALVEHSRFASAAHDDLESICREFLKDRKGPLRGAAFGIAGPIVRGRTQTTNLPWVVESDAMRRLLGCPVSLINDLEATAHGVPALAPSEVHVLNEGEEVEGGARAILAAGTGLGEGYMVYDRTHGHYVPAASEGGHGDYAPRDAREIELLLHFMSKYGHVSVERIVSGMGIADIFGYLAATGRYEVPASLLEEIGASDAAAVISRSALTGAPPICVDTMRQFVASYGAEAGNLALKIMALGGVYIGGGIAPKILPLLSDGLFVESFAGKGRFAALLRRIPLRVILNQRTALVGAALVASRLASDPGAR